MGWSGNLHANWKLCTVILKWPHYKNNIQSRIIKSSKSDCSAFVKPFVSWKLSSGIKVLRIIKLYFFKKAIYFLDYKIVFISFHGVDY